ncbi:MAG: DUF742 domain-containing protein [Actinomycetota bacterium]
MDETEAATEADESFVRPYMITGGRTVGAAGDIPIETLVVARQTRDGLNPDHAMVVVLCAEPLSVAEIAVHMRQPIGVARVLVADLTASGHVEMHDTAATEGAAIVRRLLDGIRAL